MNCQLFITFCSYNMNYGKQNADIWDKNKTRTKSSKQKAG